MIEADITQRVAARLWTQGLQDLAEVEDVSCAVEIEEEDANEFAMHTYIGDEGSLVSYYFDRETLIGLATRILKATVLV